MPPKDKICHTGVQLGDGPEVSCYEEVRKIDVNWFCLNVLCVALMRLTTISINISEIDQKIYLKSRLLPDASESLYADDDFIQQLSSKLSYEPVSKWVRRQLGNLVEVFDCWYSLLEKLMEDDAKYTNGSLSWTEWSSTNAIKWS